MELTVSVSDQIGSILRKRAKDKGREINDFVKEIIEDQALTPTLDELLAPVRTEVTEQGLTEDDIDSFMYELRQKVGNEKKGSNQP